jgi:hypothetical protein
MGKHFGCLSPCEGHTSTRSLGTQIWQSARTIRLSSSSSASRPHPVIWLQPCRMTLSRKPLPFFFVRTAKRFKWHGNVSDLGSQNCSSDGGEGLPLTSRCCILYIYSTNKRTEYFKHAAHSPFFPLQNAVYFKMLPFFGSCIIQILYTGCAKI